MIDPAHGVVRHLRAMSAALACVTTAFAAHTVAGGSAGLGTVVTTFVLSGAVAWALAGARLARPQMLGLLVLCQVGVHLASMAGQPADHTMGASMLASHAAATALSLVLMSRGEAFVWAMARRLGLRRITVLSHLDVPVLRPLLVSIPAARPGGTLASRLLPVRGPPTKHAFVAPSL